MSVRTNQFPIEQEHSSLLLQYLQLCAGLEAPDSSEQCAGKFAQLVQQSAVMANHSAAAVQDMTVSFTFRYRLGNTRSKNIFQCGSGIVAQTVLSCTLKSSTLHHTDCLHVFCYRLTQLWSMIRRTATPCSQSSSGDEDLLLEGGYCRTQPF